MVHHLAGKKFGDTLVIRKLNKRTPTGKNLWECKCLCGKVFEAITNTLTSKTKPRESCGCCEWHIKHNEAYVSWMGMKQRCNDKNAKDYKYYGARGITYDSRWEKFTEFYKDMGDPPKDTRTGERLSLDRVDVHKNYSKDNCKWSDRSEQQLNKTSS